ncbi:serine protease family S10 [Achlya hypogyna]|uniref:Carboxypeptidase n=1 Tax=Achlya hypogyna TaxID=1202772 RepID=A0A1V9YCP7_ACHHY|nr:serine protease family S10 [Achlya hypogyna]
MGLRALIVGLAAAVAAATIPAHKVSSLPGLHANVSQYAGHLRLPSVGHDMFYWLVEAQEDPASAPLVLWLNGGPGCSSLNGLFTEVGPFVVNGDLTLTANPYAWTRKANIVFVESPVGVGFSTPVLDDYDDSATTAGSHEFLVQFLAAYPEYAERDFYIFGESYAGIYIPLLVHKMLEAPVPHLRLRGFGVGNPFTDAATDGGATFDYLYAHGMIALETYRAIQAQCPPRILAMCLGGTGCTEACAMALVEGFLGANEAAMDPYDIYGDVCLLDQARLLLPAQVRPLHRGVVGPCQASFMTAYLQRADVQAAIHVQADHVVEWTKCNVEINAAYDRTSSALPVYPAILAAGLKALVYSGDTDAVVNFMGTQRWLADLKLPVVDKWHAWFGPDKQLAGYTEGYTNVTFTTVKGAGHMVPATRPLHALYMFECFVFGDAACASFSYPRDELEELTGVQLTQAAPAASSWRLTVLGVAGILVVLGALLMLRRYRQRKAASPVYVPLRASRYSAVH